jgi:hypothetical protein
MRRTASLDALYKHPHLLNWNQSGPPLFYTIINVDKATQTEESFVEKMKGTSPSQPPIQEFRMEKLIRQRIQRNSRGGENSVSSQTLSPVHGEFSRKFISEPSLGIIIFFSWKF